MAVHVVVKQRPKKPSERLAEAALTYAEAEDDKAWLRAKDNLRKAAVAYAPTAQREVISEATRKALAEKKAQGVKLGRPSKVHPALVIETLETVGAVAKVAALLRVSVRTVYRLLRNSEPHQ